MLRITKDDLENLMEQIPAWYCMHTWDFIKKWDVLEFAPRPQKEIEELYKREREDPDDWWNTLDLLEWAFPYLSQKRH